MAIVEKSLTEMLEEIGYYPIGEKGYQILNRDDTIPNDLAELGLSEDDTDCYIASVLDSEGFVPDETEDATSAAISLAIGEPWEKGMFPLYVKGYEGRGGYVFSISRGGPGFDYQKLTAEMRRRLAEEGEEFEENAHSVPNMQQILEFELAALEASYDNNGKTVNIMVKNVIPC